VGYGEYYNPPHLIDISYFNPIFNFILIPFIILRVFFLEISNLDKKSIVENSDEKL